MSGTNDLGSRRLKEETIHKYIRLAIEEGVKASEANEVAVGCVMVRIDEEGSDETVIARAHNLTNSLGNASLHCEINCINAILGAKNQQVDYFCSQAVDNLPAIYRIKEVYFGCFNDRFGGNGTILPLHDGKHGGLPYPSFGGYLEEECKDILKKFYERGNLNLDEDKRHRRVKKE